MLQQQQQQQQAAQAAEWRQVLAETSESHAAVVAQLQEQLQASLAEKSKLQQQVAGEANGEVTAASAAATAAAAASAGAEAKRVGAEMGRVGGGPAR